MEHFAKAAENLVASLDDDDDDDEEVISCVLCGNIYYKIRNVGSPQLEQCDSKLLSTSPGRTSWCVVLKGHSQLVHMRITYHSIATLHVTETR